MYSYESRAPEPAYTDFGIVTTRIGGGVALAMRNVPLHERRNWVWRSTP
ncbi:hypothetical protein ABZ356_17165 [Micromonospora zamorensis]